jgi:DNA-binding ferritin-like protein (Dps family)
METIVKYLYDMGYTKWSIFLAILLIFIEFNPKIKFNPISKFFAWIGSKFNSSVNKQIDKYKETVDAELKTDRKRIESLEQNLKEVSTNLQTDELSTLYWDVSCFETSIINGEKFYREQYRQIIEKEIKYKHLVEKLGLTREQAHMSEFEESMETIKEHYNQGRSTQDMMF